MYLDPTLGQWKVDRPMLIADVWEHSNTEKKKKAVRLESNMRSHMIRQDHRRENEGENK